MTIDELIDAAKAARGITSDRALCGLLGASDATISHYRTRRMLPDDAMAIRLADLAHIDPSIVLTELAIWRSHGAVRAAWQEIRDRLRGPTIA